ncbi:helix-turn-helix domain-containing protein [Polycladidibacter stylochi]|uniref:helix-turn-helix domain-containing protein n=1 Tax=Polycladidibacter stylochi TaxID=1807766 RepID=UPI000835E9AC|nr:helix-turn-helix domain-containing protein [Pseudovibrio stylochi]
MNFLDIGEVSMRSGVKPSALRYYEELGLIQSAGRSGLRRQYESGVLLRLAFINLAKSGGFSLDEIKGMFSTDGQLQIPRGRVQERVAQIDAQIEELSALRDMLSHIAVCPAPSHLQCPAFRQLLKDAVLQKKTESNS